MMDQKTSKKLLRNGAALGMAIGAINLALGLLQISNRIDATLPLPDAPWLLLTGTIVCFSALGTYYKSRIAALGMLIFVCIPDTGPWNHPDDRTLSTHNTIPLIDLLILFIIIYILSRAAQATLHLPRLQRERDHLEDPKIPAWAKSWSNRITAAAVAAIVSATLIIFQSSPTPSWSLPAHFLFFYLLPALAAMKVGKGLRSGQRFAAHVALFAVTLAALLLFALGSVAVVQGDRETGLGIVALVFLIFLRPLFIIFRSRQDFRKSALTHYVYLFFLLGPGSFWLLGKATPPVLESLAPEKMLSLYSHQGLRAREQGNLELAELYYNRVLAYRERTPGSIEHIECLIELGEIAWQRNEPYVAKTHRKRALSFLRQKAQFAWDRGDHKEARDGLKRILLIQEKWMPGSPELAQSLVYMGTLAHNRDDLDAAESYWKRALPILEVEAPNSAELARTLIYLGTISADRANIDSATDYMKRALAIQESLVPDTPELAWTLSFLATLASTARQFDVAEHYWKRTLALEELINPDSAELAQTLTHLGKIAQKKLSGFEEAKDYHRRALSIWETVAANSPKVTDSLHSLGVIHENEGNFRIAREYFSSALKIHQRFGQDHEDLADILGHLAQVSVNLNNLAAAENYWVSELSIREGQSDTSEVILLLHRLGILALSQGRSQIAEDHLEKSLRTIELAASDAKHLNHITWHLGELALDRDDFPAAKGYWERALKIHGSYSTESFEIAVCLSHLGNIMSTQGDREQSKSYYKRALSIRTTLAPEGSEVAESLSDLSELALSEGDINLARNYQEQALAIRDQVEPGSLAVAASLNGLGVIAREQGDLDLAGQYQERALSVVSENSTAIYSMQLCNETNTNSTSAQTHLARIVIGSLETASSFYALGDLAYSNRDLKMAAQYFQRALTIQEKAAPGSPEVAETLMKLGHTAHDSRQLDLAEEHYQRALSIRENIMPESQELVISLSSTGNILMRRDFSLAEKYLQRALSLSERVAPNLLGMTLNFRGSIAELKGELNNAEEYYQRALELYKGEPSQGGSMPLALTNLGDVYRKQGKLQLAEGYYRRAVTAYNQKMPNSALLAKSIENLSEVFRERGELDLARDHLERSLAIWERIDPDGFEAAQTLISLAEYAEVRDELDVADQYYRRIHAIAEHLPPNGTEVGIILTHLGHAHNRRGELDDAAEFYERARAIHSMTEPEGLCVADTLGHLGSVARSQGETVLAQEYHERGLAIRRDGTQPSDSVSSSYCALGRLAAERGEMGDAREYFENALSVIQGTMPGSLEEADALRNVAEVHRTAKRPEIATNYFRRGVEALESQIEKLGSVKDTRANYRDRTGYVYRSYIEHLVESDDPATAFHILERYRARIFLEMITQRDFWHENDKPDLVTNELATNAARYDQTQQEMESLDPTRDAEEISRHSKELRRLARQRAETIENMPRSSPGVALRYPEPLRAEAAREILEPGTVMLSYSVGKKRTDLFVLTGDEIDVYQIPIGAGKLEREVNKLRKYLERSGARHIRNFRRSSRKLYSALIEKASEEIQRNKRVVIVPDGPLHELPFGALLREVEVSGTSDRRVSQYLIEWRPLHFVLSATVYADLKQRIQKETEDDRSSEISLGLFGGPVYGKRRSRRFEALPYTRSEVEAIAELFPQRATTFLGERATEDTFKSIGGSFDILHVATHGRFNRRLPLDSALVFSAPKKHVNGHDNGLLQTWEIFDGLRLNADLIVLSGCDTALGKRQGGEGLIGLTRAFQYAGARSVAATLWEVDDQPTAELMVRFYRQLKAGKTKDEALRAAQIEFIRGRGGDLMPQDVSIPYYWAAFQIYGNWQ